MVATAHDHADCVACQAWEAAGASWPRPCVDHWTGEPTRDELQEMVA